MKAVMLSIQPKWCKLIVSGNKNVEVRKSAPKLKPPFKVYIYCSKGKDRLLDVIRDGDDVFGHVHHGKPVFIKTPESSFQFGNSGKVIAEFTCYRVIPFLMKDGEPLFLQSISGLRTWLTKDEAAEYIGNQKGYLWQISRLKVYDKPKALRSFYKPCPYKLPDGSRMDVPCPCDKYTHIFDEESGLIDCTRRMKVPPQSWCYVEELKDGK